MIVTIALWVKNVPAVVRLAGKLIMRWLGAGKQETSARTSVCPWSPLSSLFDPIDRRLLPNLSERLFF